MTPTLAQQNIIHPHGQSIAQEVQDSNFESCRDWGKEIKNNGHVTLYEHDFGNGNKLFTFMIWAQE